MYINTYKECRANAVNRLEMEHTVPASTLLQHTTLITAKLGAHSTWLRSSLSCLR